MIKYSIIIPAYNVERYIGDTIESACAASDDNTEIIIINDGSTDATKNQIENIISLNDENHHIVFIDQDNQGVSAARNAGIKASGGKYLIFCDGDDLCKPDLISTIDRSLDRDIDLLLWGFDAIEYDTKKTSVMQSSFGDIQTTNACVFKSILMGDNRIRLGSFAVNKNLLSKYNIQYTVGCLLSQDVEFMYKCLAKATDIEVIDDILFSYVKRSGSVMFRYNINRFEAPRTMRRIYEYVRDNTTLLEDEEIDEYLHNGFLLQHIMYSFDACIPYLDDKSILHEFERDYATKYEDVEKDICRISRDIKIFPRKFNRNRVKLFLLNRKLYVKLMLIRKRLS